MRRRSLLQLRARSVEAHPVGVRVHREDRELRPVTADELEVVVHAREHGPCPGPPEALAVVAIEELAKVERWGR